jgi:hypothetical protein
MSESIILEEEIDENYEPTTDEIEEYAQWLGMDLDQDRDLFYIAKEGLKAPLPEPWKPCKTKEGEIYYFNFENGESVWEHPCDEYYRKMFEEAKAGKMRRSLSGSKKTGATSSGNKKQKKPSNAVEIIENFSIPKKQKKSLGALDSDNKFIKREDDTILKLEKEKKLKRKRESMELKLEADLTKMKENFYNEKARLCK